MLVPGVQRATRGSARPRTTITRYERQSQVQPPSQVTSHSPKRDPIVTGVRRPRNLVSSCMNPSCWVHIFIPLRMLTVELLKEGEMAQTYTMSSHPCRAPRKIKEF